MQQLLVEAGSSNRAALTNQRSRKTRSSRAGIRINYNARSRPSKNQVGRNFAAVNTHGRSQQQGEGDNRGRIHRGMKRYLDIGIGTFYREGETRRKGLRRWRPDDTATGLE